jgi:threonine/homoserine/homoserine lactone efflux protein
VEQFLAVAGAHLLALLSPGPDLFLIARTATAAGRRVAGGVCAGIALANAVFVAAAFAGLSVLRPGTVLFTGVQLAGGAFLVVLGVRFLRAAGTGSPELGTGGPGGATPGRWWAAAGTGLASGLLNPKNALFYASLAAVLTGSGTGGGVLALYGAWMVAVVLGWDLLVAALIGNPAVLRRFGRALPWLERGSGLVLLLLGAGVVVAAVR